MNLTNLPALLFALAMFLLVAVLTASTVGLATFIDKAPSWLSGMGDFMTGTAAVGAAIYGARQLHAWRAESIGKRRVELAETVLSTFYQAAEHIHSARAPFVLAAEQLVEEGGKIIKVSASYVPFLRISRHVDFFQRMQAQKHLFSAYFGKGYGHCFDDIRLVAREIQDAATELDLTENDGNYSTSSQHTRDIALRPISREDKIAARVDAIVAEIEAVCLPEIQQSAAAKESAARRE